MPVFTLPFCVIALVHLGMKDRIPWLTWVDAPTIPEDSIILFAKQESQSGKKKIGGSRHMDMDKSGRGGGGDDAAGRGGRTGCGRRTNLRMRARGRKTRCCRGRVKGLLQRIGR
jgi:hypothetical protein